MQIVGEPDKPAINPIPDSMVHAALGAAMSSGLIKDVRADSFEKARGMLAAAMAVYVVEIRGRRIEALKRKEWKVASDCPPGTEGGGAATPSNSGGEAGSPHLIGMPDPAFDGVARRPLDRFVEKVFLPAQRKLPAGDRVVPPGNRQRGGRSHTWQFGVKNTVVVTFPMCKELSQYYAALSARLQKSKNPYHRFRGMTLGRKYLMNAWFHMLFMMGNEAQDAAIAMAVAFMDEVYEKGIPMARFNLVAPEMAESVLDRVVDDVEDVERQMDEKAEKNREKNRKNEAKKAARAKRDSQVEPPPNAPIPGKPEAPGTPPLRRRLKDT